MSAPRLSAIGLASCLAFTLAAAPATPAAPTVGVASEASTAVCIEQMEVTFTPGLDLSRVRRVGVTTGGESGRIVCVGSLEGQPVTGPGTIGLDGVMRGTCLGGEITGTLKMTVPTMGGQKHLELPLTIGWQEDVGLSSSPPGRNAVVEFVPSGGDCLTSPVTKAVLLAEDVFSS